MKKIFLMAFVAAGVLSSTDVKPDFSGSWKLNLDRSANEAGGKLEYVGLSMNVSHQDPKLHITQQVTSANYSRTIEMNVTTDGVEHKFTAFGQAAVASARWDGNVLVTDYRRSNPALNPEGTVLRTIRRLSLSRDGKMIDAKAEVTFNGQRAEGVSGHEVWDKQ